MSGLTARICGSSVTQNTLVEEGAMTSAGAVECGGMIRCPPQGVPMNARENWNALLTKGLNDHVERNG